jgi:hypothetical protein
MAIDKKLIHFKNKEKFEEELANNNILDSSIVFIQDSKEISTHGTVYKTVCWSILGESSPEPEDPAANKKSHTKTERSETKWGTDY